MRHLTRTTDATLHSFVQLGTNTATCGSGGLWWMYSTNGGTSWSCGSQISSSTSPLLYADSRVDSSNNIYIVYSAATSGGNAAYDVIYRKFTASGCSTAPCDWTVESPQTVLDGDGSGDNAGFHYATIELEGTTRVWIAVREYDGTNYQVGTYYSNDLSTAPTWTASQATLDTAGTNASYHYPTIVRYGTKIGVIYNAESGSDLTWRYRDDGDGLTSWVSSATICTSTCLVRFPSFSAAGDAAGNIYLAYEDADVRFHHYQSSWSAPAMITTTNVSDHGASVVTDGTDVWVLYTDTTGVTGGINRKLVYKKGVSPFATANFDTNPTPVVSNHGTLDKVWLYDASSDSYQDETTDTASTNTADIAHTDSNTIVKDTGDIIYLGETTTFDAITWSISTVSSGGTNNWEYCSAVDGSSVCTTWSTLSITSQQNPGWKGGGYLSFTPPVDWQASKVNGEGTSYYYIRDSTLSSYITGPIGTQITTIPVPYYYGLAMTNAGVFALWTENNNSPTKIKFEAILLNNSNPDTPSSLGGHVSGAFTGDTTPTLSFTLSDPDSSDTVKYRILVDDSSDFGSLVVDYTSSLASQGSTSFTVGQAVGSGSYTTGSAGQTLTDGNYYWQVKAIDDNSAESSYATANSGAIAFKVDSIAPSIPGAPSSSSATDDSTPTWSWTASSDSGSGLAGTPYSIQWSQASDFSSGVFSDSSNTNTYTHSTALADGTWYSRVNATDSVSNTSSYSSSGSFTVNTTTPTPTPTATPTPTPTVTSIDLELDSPGNNDYVNNERPTFRWKVPGSALSALSKYIFEIDNPSTGDSDPSGDFTIDNIPVSRTWDYETGKFRIRYENFSDSDSDNNYVSIYTKSSSEWGFQENDGKLMEGKVTWRVKAVSSTAAVTTFSRTLFVDKKSPEIQLEKINDVSFSGQNYSTTDKTLTIVGKITDFLSGGDHAKTQNDDGPKIASGPKTLELKIEKKDSLGYPLISLYTINVDKSFYSCDNKEITDNIKGTCDKYFNFEYKSKEPLELGNYKITMTGKDKAENSSTTELTVEVTTFSEIATVDEKNLIDKEIKTLAPELEEEVKEEIEITKPINPAVKEKNGIKMAEISKRAIGSTGRYIGNILKGVGSSVSFINRNIGGLLVTVDNAVETVGKKIGDGYNQIAKKAPGVSRSILLGIGGGINTTLNVVQTTQKIIYRMEKTATAGVKESIANVIFAVGGKTQEVSDNFGNSIIKFGTLFVSAPTKITNVKVVVLSSTSAKISWQTNHPANGKVNYGSDRTYPFDVQSEKRVKNHEFVLKNLEPDTVYYFEVMSYNKNYVYDAYREFRTLK